MDTAIRVDRMEAPGGAFRALVMRAPARVSWDLTLPARGHLKSRVALVHTEDPRASSGVSARVGIVGGRTYETLFILALAPLATGSPAWMPVDVDLSAYSGWQWSLFYRPSGDPWRVIFAADATPGGELAWAEPQIDFTR